MQMLEQQKQLEEMEKEKAELEQLKREKEELTKLLAEKEKLAEAQVSWHIATINIAWSATFIRTYVYFSALIPYLICTLIILVFILSPLPPISYCLKQHSIFTPHTHIYANIFHRILRFTPPPPRKSKRTSSS